MNTNVETRICSSCKKITHEDDFCPAKYKQAKDTCIFCVRERVRDYKRGKSGFGKTRDELTESELQFRIVETEKKKVFYENNHIRVLCQKAKCRAKKRQMEFEIDYTEMVIPEVCPALNIPLVKSNGAASHNSVSIDRLDSTVGYTKKNVNILSSRANTIKSDATFEEFEAIYFWWKLQREQNG